MSGMVSACLERGSASSVSLALGGRGLGFRVKGLRVGRVSGFGFWVWGLRLRV